MDFEIDEDIAEFAEIAITQFNDPAAYARATQKVFEERAHEVAAELVRIALHGATDRSRIDAGKYIVDRVLGRIKDRDDAAAVKEPWEDIFGAVTREPTAAEREAGMRVTKTERKE